MKISKELVSAVLDEDVYVVIADNKKIEDCLRGDLSGDYLAYRTNESHGLSKWKYLNLFELVHKNTKEWAKNQGYIITSNKLRSVTISTIDRPLSVIAWVDNQLNENDTEEIRVLKACEWILENK